MSIQKLSITCYGPPAPAYDLKSVPTATSDSVIFDKELNQDILKIFQETGCTLLLGDGAGLNYLSTDKKITKILEELKNS